VLRQTPAQHDPRGRSRRRETCVPKITMSRIVSANRLLRSGVARHGDKKAPRRSAGRARARAGTPFWRRSTVPTGRNPLLRSLIPPSLDDNETETLSQRPFQPDIILASQFFGRLRRQALSGEPERQLLAAVLEDGVSCFQEYVLANRPRDRRLFKEAQDWIMGEGAARGEEERPAVSFEYICEVLGFDPDYLRAGLRRWQERHLAHRQSVAGGPRVAAG
jgi:hypothetical protein